MKANRSQENVVPAQVMMTESTEKERFFNSWAPSYDWLLPSVFYQAVHQRLLSCIDLPQTPSVLDLGCGTGKLLNRLTADYPNLTGVGLDFSAAMLAQAREKRHDRDRLQFIQGTATSLPFEAAQFDAAFCTMSFLHYPQPVAVLAEVRRVLKPGGAFYLADYTPPKWTGQARLQIGQIAGGITFYSPAARQEMGQQAGFTCDRHVYLLGPILLTVLQRPTTP